MNSPVAGAKPTKVLFVSHWSGSGGAEKALFEIVRHLHVVLHIPCICVVNWKGSLYRNLVRIGVPCYVIPYKWWAGKDIPLWKRIVRTAANIPMSVALAALVMAARPTVVYSNTFTICVGAVAARISRRPHIWHMHELFGANAFDLGMFVSLRLINVLSDKVIVVSDDVRRFYGTFVTQEKLVRIHNALPSPAGPPAPDVDPVPGRLVIVGNVTATKGQEDAVRAVAVLVDRGFDVSLRVVGDTADLKFKKQLDDLILDLGLISRVEFSGLVPDPAPDMSAAEVVLVCARGEGFGRVTVEAMKLGRPVVGARSGATPEILQDGRLGLLYTPENSIELADSIQALISDPALRTAIVRRAQEHAVSYFAMDRYVSEWLPVVQSVERAR